MKDNYISKQAAITIPIMPKKYRKYQTMNIDDTYEQGWDDCQRCIDKLPAADVVPVRHANWIDTENYYRRWRCSACSGHTKEAHPQFCPFCGAKMDGNE